jgi:hypothetical protein
MKPGPRQQVLRAFDEASRNVNKDLEAMREELRRLMAVVQDTKSAIKTGKEENDG